MARITVIICLASLAGGVQAAGAVKLPTMFGEHMVLQRGVEIPVWGWASPGEKVTVTLGENRAEAAADANGDWSVRLAPMRAGGPWTLTVASDGGERMAVRDVLVGEVWVASGQSWMTWDMARVRDAEREIREANYPQIRMFNVRETTALSPQKDCPGTWSVCTPKAVASWSGVGYFFARHLHRELGVPVGILHTSVPGTTAWSWTDRQSLQADKAMNALVEKLDRRVLEFGQEFHDQHGAALRKWLEDVEKAGPDGNQPAFPAGITPGPTPSESWREWLPRADRDKADGKPLSLPPVPQGGKDPRDHWQHMPTIFYNAMIHPLIPYSVKGILWWQGGGEGPEVYRSLFPLMIRSWRRNWGQGDLPFLFVQRPNYNDPDRSYSKLPEFREAQAAALSLPGTAMALAIDVADDPNDLHPTNMQVVGKRLALAAEAVAYGLDRIWSGPVYESMSVEDGRVRVRFRHVGGGLVAKGGGPLQGFEVAGKDGKFVPAQAVIDGQAVVVSSPDVPQPAAVRYAWAPNPTCNLYNREDLPARPFRTPLPVPRP